MNKKIIIISGVSIVALAGLYYGAKALVISKIAEMRYPDGMNIIDGRDDSVIPVEQKRAEESKYIWSEGDNLFSLLETLKNTPKLGGATGMVGS